MEMPNPEESPNSGFNALILIAILVGMVLLLLLFKP